MCLPAGFWPEGRHRAESSGIRVDRSRVTYLGQLHVVGVAVILAMAVRPARAWVDYDVFWHLANGRLLTKGGGTADRDAFSWSAPGHEYANYSAHVDRLFYLLWQADGAWCLGLFAVLTYVLALLPFAMLIGRHRPRPLVEALALSVIAFALWPFIGARPHFVGLVLFGWLVYLLEAPFTVRRAALAGALLGLWANAHGTFQIGFGLVAAAALAWGWQRQTRDAALAGASLLIGLVMSLLSPIGPRIWLLPLRSVSNVTMPFNDDWAGLRPLTPTYAAMGLLLVLALALGVWRRGDVRGLAAIGLALPTIQLARFTLFAAPLLGLAVLARLLERYPRLAMAAPPEEATGGAAKAAGPHTMMPTALLVCGVAVLVAMPWRLTSLPQAALPAVQLPVGAVDRLLACGEPAPTWSDYNWSGYLLWRGDARYTVGIDGRAETVYPDQVFMDYLKVAIGQRGWESIVQDSPVRYAITPATSGTAIATLPGWREVYRDEIATVAVRDGAAWSCATGAGWREA